MNREKAMNREEAFELLKKYNKEPYHIRHGLMVEAIMREFARINNYDEEFWGIAGLLHDIDYEMYPEEHCIKAVELLKNANASDELIHAVVSHGYNICSDVEPVLYMEKVLYATDELTGIIASLINMRPSKNAQGMEVSTLKKKFKDKTFARGCSRDIVKAGAEMLGVDLNYLFEHAIKAIEQDEEFINNKMASL